MTSAIEIQNIISELTECEKKILIIIGKLNVSPKKNNREETILNKLSNKDRENCAKSLKLLVTKGLLFKYRNKNYGASSLGMNVAIKLKEENVKERCKDLSRILMIINNK